MLFVAEFTNSDNLGLTQACWLTTSSTWLKRSRLAFDCNQVRERQQSEDVDFATRVRNPHAFLYISCFVTACFDTWTKDYPNFRIRVIGLSLLANVSHLSWTLEGGMQSLGHHSTSFSSRKFPSSKRRGAFTSTDTKAARKLFSRSWTRRRRS